MRELSTGLPTEVATELATEKATEETTDEATEENTEPYSQIEMAARMRSHREKQFMHEAAAAAHAAVHLDDLVVPTDKDIRILVRPLTRARSVSPGNLDNCEWLQLTAEVAEPKQPEHKVLAVTQTERDIKFSVRMPGERHPPLWCELYYDPSSSNQMFLNCSDLPLTLSRVPQNPAISPAQEHVVNPQMMQKLTPGTWRIKVTGVNVLDFRIVEKRPVIRRLPFTPRSLSASSSDMLNLSGKRQLVAEDSASSADKRQRAEDDISMGEDGVVMFMRPGNAGDPLVFPLPTEDRRREIVSTRGNPLVELEDGAEVEIPGGEVYTIKKVDLIASTSLSAVARAEFSRVPDSIITIKVLKTSLTQRANATARPQEEERNVMRQSETWLREFVNHERLNHKSIPRLFGGDSRYLSLYMEHIEAKDLTIRGAWQNAQTTMFTGSRLDAEKILRDISSALDYLHAKNLTHNDIKPGNIIYNAQRGAVLCDFGMSFERSAAQSGIGGTPYYIGPEYIIHKLRGTSGDVWAFGVTMLYVLGKLGLPEARSIKKHPEYLYWQIREVNAPAHAQRAQQGSDGLTALEKMRTWLDIVGEAKKRLRTSDPIERLVAKMLTLKPHHRITMRKVVETLARIPIRNDG